jgi:CubicO group peptidase (beta-lactamase class C family)
VFPTCSAGSGFPTTSGRRRPAQPRRSLKPQDSNDRRFLTGVIPAANVITTANELSRFFEIFRAGGELDGVRVMEEWTIRRALTEQSHLEVDFSLLFPTRFSYGLMLGAKLVSLYGRDTDLAFGHLGLINIMGWPTPSARSRSA